MKNISKTKPYYVPSSIQKLFIIGIASLYLIQSGFILYSTFSQFQQGSDYFPQLRYFAVYNSVPLIVFGLAYILNPRKLSRLPKTFESLLITIAAYIGWTFIMMLSPMILFGLIDPIDHVLLEYLSSAIFISIYVAILLVLRKKGTWS
jgi:hypothetical protein